MTAKTPTERVAALRARRAAVGVTEVRGIFAPTEQHAAVKAAAARALKKRPSGQKNPGQTCDSPAGKGTSS